MLVSLAGEGDCFPCNLKDWFLITYLNVWCCACWVTECIGWKHNFPLGGLCNGGSKVYMIFVTFCSRETFRSWRSQCLFGSVGRKGKEELLVSHIPGLHSLLRCPSTLPAMCEVTWMMSVTCWLCCHLLPGAGCCAVVLLQMCTNPVCLLKMGQWRKHVAIHRQSCSQGCDAHIEWWCCSWEEDGFVAAFTRMWFNHSWIQSVVQRRMQPVRRGDCMVFSVVQELI